MLNWRSFFFTPPRFYLDDANTSGVPLPSTHSSQLTLPSLLPPLVLQDESALLAYDLGGR